MDCYSRSLYGSHFRHCHVKRHYQQHRLGRINALWWGLSAVLKAFRILSYSKVKRLSIHSVYASPFLVIVATFIIFLTEFNRNTASAALLVPIFCCDCRPNELT